MKTCMVAGCGRKHHAGRLLFEPPPPVQPHRFAAFDAANRLRGARLRGQAPRPRPVHEALSAAAGRAQAAQRIAIRLKHTRALAAVASALFHL